MRGTTMDEADWVVLRLLRKIATEAPRLTLSPEVRNSTVYLDRKYGTRKFYKCIDLLNKEMR
jgi:hypothetical protein